MNYFFFQFGHVCNHAFEVEEEKDNDIETYSPKFFGVLEDDKIFLT